MDLTIRYFDEKLKLVQTVYFNFMLYERSTAKYLVVFFLEVLSEISFENQLQISMNGPNVNWRSLKKIADRLEGSFNRHKHPDLSKLFNLGYCALHVAHGAFKTGCTKAKMQGCGGEEAGFDFWKILNAGASTLITSTKKPPAERKNSLK